ncbi:MAG TPA: phospholipase D family protein [Steroidobacteraceae bacterium]|nr:phospholipase D family protein [Steroidobacteraceae bacterium]
MSLRNTAFPCVCLLLLLSGCAQLPEKPTLPAENSIAVGADGKLDQVIAPAESAHPGQSGFRLSVEGTEAFVLRAHSARLAVRTLDVQTYIWHSDTTGLYLARELLEAADRGVRVRLLVDDMDARARNAGYAALAAHPRVEVRLFNPFASRSGALGFASESLRDFGRINRRMHNKSWIADNRIALVGGRNLGDEYFAASEEVNFVDLDFTMVGPVVRDVSRSFDHFWNSASSWPIQVLDPDSVSPAALEKLRGKLDKRAASPEAERYAQALRGDDGIRRLVAGDWALRWSSNYQFVSDIPEKVHMQKKDSARAVVGAAVGGMVRDAKTSLEVISPYFVPGQRGATALIDRVKAGTDVRILTNSLAANDVAAVHGGYERHRRELIKGGVKIWELKPTNKPEPTKDIDPDEVGETQSAPKKKGSGFKGSGASLHTKALTADGHNSFVGSYNLDPRSTWLNCEQGVIVDEPAIAGQLEGIFKQQTAGERAWQVKLHGHELQWTDGTQTRDSEPDASFGRKFQAWLARTFHLDAQL